MAKKINKIKEVIKKKDNRFWLMIFVIISTSFIFIFWISELGVMFSGENKTSKAEEDSGFEIIKNDAQDNLSQTFEEFWEIVEEESEKKNPQIENSVVDIIRIEEEIERRKSEEKVEVSSSTEASTSSLEELESSEETIESLKKRIEELEKNLQKE
jgi:preprotein translocase subunit SecF